MSGSLEKEKKIHRMYKHLNTNRLLLALVFRNAVRKR
jgi:hypothetical protein